MNWRGKGSKKRGTGDARSADWRGNSTEPADWREGQDKGSAAPSPTSTAFFSPDWWKRKQYQTEGRKFRRILLLCGLGIALIVIFFIWVLPYLIIPIVTPVQVFAVAKHENDGHFLLPPNGFAFEDASYFYDTFSESREIKVSIGGQEKNTSIVTQDQLLSQLKNWLKKARPGGPDKAMILYLSCHGLVNDVGAPCLITSDADPCAPEKWLTLETILDTVQAEKREARKLILLDCTRIHTLWSLGILYNDFHDAVQRMITKRSGASADVNHNNLAIINSTGPGEVGLTDPRRGNSLFGYYCVRGLAGEADVKGGNSDKKVSVQELQNYLRREVSMRARKERNAPQTPTLLSGHGQTEDAVDFQLVEFAKFRGAEALEKGQTARRTKSRKNAQGLAEACNKQWREFDELPRDRAIAHAPLRWARIEHQLLRLESYVLAGTAYQKSFADVRKEVRDEMKAIAKENPEHSLPVINVSDIGTDEVRRGRDALDRWLAAETVAAKADPKTGDSGDDAAAETPPPYRERIAAVWQAVLNGECDSDQFEVLLKFIDQPPERTASEPAEVHLLRNLNEWVASPPARELVIPALECFHLAQQATSATEPRTHFWVEALVDSLDERRREAEDRLVAFDESVPNVEQRMDRLSEQFRRLTGAVDSAATPSYRAVVEKREAIAKAFRTRDDALARIPWLALWVSLQSRAVTNAKERSVTEDYYEAFDELRIAVEKLGDELDIVESGDDINTLSAHTADVEDKLRRLTTACEESVDEASGQRNEKLNPIELLLRMPLWGYKTRETLRNNYLNILFERPGPTDPKLEEKSSPLPDDAPYLARISKGTHPLVSITGASDKTFSPPADDASRGVSLDYLRRQGVAVRKFLRNVVEDTNKLKASYEKRFLSGERTEDYFESVRADLSAADRFVRAHAAFAPDQKWVRNTLAYDATDLSPQAAKNSTAEIGPALYLQYVDHYFYLLWQCRRVARDAWGPSPVEKSAYFEEVAQRWFDAAANEKHCRSATAFRKPARTLLDSRVAALSRNEDSLSDFRIESLKRDRSKDLAYRAMLAYPDQVRTGTASLFVGKDQFRPVPLATQDVLDLRRISIDVDGTPSREVYFEFTPETAQSLGGMMRLNALYRFHHRAAEEKIVQDIAGDVICHRVPPFRAPTVEIVDESVKNTWMIFVLDCSYSMSKGGVPTRMDSAKKAMRDILQELQNSSPWVGILCYGHRSKFFGANFPYGIAVRPKNGGAPVEVQPGFVVQPIDPRSDHDWLKDPVSGADMFAVELTPPKLRTIEEALDKLEPTGQTPLYLSMLTALEKFKAPPRNVDELRLVVVTDGINDPGNTVTLNPFALALVGAKNETSLGDVEKLLVDAPKLRDVKIDVVYIGSDAELNSKERNRFRELKSFATKPEQNRNFRQVGRLAVLKEEIKKALGTGDYRVSCTDDPLQEDNIPISLDKVWTTQHDRFDERHYEVLLHGPADRQLPKTELDLSGGERIQLWLADNTFRHDRYSVGFDGRATPEIQDPTDLTRSFIVFNHLPEPDPNRVGELISLSIQNADPAKFSPRPRRMWVEVRPIGDDNKAIEPPFVFYDMSFQDRTPVPVIDMHAPRWPASKLPGRNRLADVRFWFTLKDLEQSNAIWRMNVNHAADRSPIQLPSDGEVELQVDLFEDKDGRGGYTIQVVELHTQADTMRRFMVHIDREQDLREICHTYIDDAEVHQVKHVFRFKRRPLNPPPNIVVTSVDRYKNRRDVVSGDLRLVLPRR